MRNKTRSISTGTSALKIRFSVSSVFSVVPFFFYSWRFVFWALHLRWVKCYEILETIATENGEA